MKMPRPAKEVREEVLAERQARKDKRFAEHMRDLAKRIEENKARGKVNVLALPDNVVQRLEELGYAVCYHNACGMHDMSSHTISWGLD